MWPLFYLPWALTVHSPTLGLVGTTFFVFWHYTAKAHQMQHVEVYVKNAPQLFEKYVKRTEPEDPKEAGGATAPVPTPAPPQPAPVPTPEKKKKSPYVWSYAQWGAGQ